MIAARLTPGAILVRNSSHFARYCPFQVDEAGDIPARAGQARNETIADRIGDAQKYDRDRPRLPLKCGDHRSRVREDHIGLQADQFLREHPYPVRVPGRPTKVDPQVAAIGPPQLPKA
jgi:hypothetical protein